MKIKKLRFQRKRVFLFLFLFLFLLGITVGYAFVKTGLSIEGIARIRNNSN